MASLFMQAVCRRDVLLVNGAVSMNVGLISFIYLLKVWTARPLVLCCIQVTKQHEYKATAKI
jgi:hypothetical protein